MHNISTVIHVYELRQIERGGERSEPLNPNFKAAAAAATSCPPILN